MDENTSLIWTELKHEQKPSEAAGRDWTQPILFPWSKVPPGFMNSGHDSPVYWNGSWVERLRSFNDIHSIKKLLSYETRKINWTIWFFDDRHGFQNDKNRFLSWWAVNFIWLRQIYHFPFLSLGGRAPPPHWVIFSSGHFLTDWRELYRLPPISEDEKYYTYTSAGNIIKL